MKHKGPPIKKETKATITKDCDAIIGISAVLAVLGTVLYWGLVETLFPIAANWPDGTDGARRSGPRFPLTDRIARPTIKARRCPIRQSPGLAHRRAALQFAECVLLAHAVVGDFNRSVALLFGFRFLVVIDLFRRRNFPVVFAIRRSNLLVHSHDLIRMFSGCRWARS